MVLAETEQVKPGLLDFRKVCLSLFILVWLLAISVRLGPCVLS